MEIPKTLWLKKHMPAERFKRCMLFECVVFCTNTEFPPSTTNALSLPDYLTYRATSSLARSTCSLACKCSYVPPGTKMIHKCDGGIEEISTDGWSARFFNKIGTSVFTSPIPPRT